METVLTYTNKVKENVEVTYVPITGNMWSDKGRMKTLIQRVLINGKWIKGAIYTSAVNERQIKSAVSSIRASNRHMLRR